MVQVLPTPSQLPPVPRTTAASAIAVFRSPTGDAMFPVKVTVPWGHVREVELISFTFHVPAGYEAEVVTGEGNSALCETHAIPDPSLDPDSRPLAALVDIAVHSSSSFLFGVKFSNSHGQTGAEPGLTGIPLSVATWSRVYAR